MIRSYFSMMLALGLAACASAGTSAGSDTGEQVKRNTTLITSVDAAGRSVVTPITTQSYAGARAVEMTAGADDVFGVLGEAYADLGIQVGTIDPPNRTVGNTRIQARGRLGRQPMSRYLDCGQTGLRGPAADAFPIRLSVLSTVVPTGTTSRLQTTVEGAYVSAEQNGVTACTSTGELEGSLAHAVMLRLSRR